MHGISRRLYSRGPSCRGLSVDADGASLGPNCVLVRRTGSGYRTVNPEEAASIQRLVFASDRPPGWLFHQCCRIAKALNENQIALAQIYGVHSAPDDLDAQRIAKLATAASVVKANFNPDEPRIPAGNPDGGEWTDEGGDQHDGPLSGSSGRGKGEPSSSAGGDKSSPNEFPPEIPGRIPAIPQETNSIVRRSAEWLRWASAVGANVVPDTRVRAFLRALEATAWAAEYLPEILAYLDAPKTLEELEKAVDNPRLGYQVHHIVEAQYDSAREDSNANRFRDRLEERDNLVRIPRWKHVEISSWYSRNNEAYGGLTPREFLRGKSWDEQYQLGLSILRKFGVLK